MADSDGRDAQTLRPPIWRMVREAIDTLGPSTTNVAVRDWILRRYPGTNKSSLACHIILCTVNHETRVHYPQNSRPRLANTQYDFLYRTARGRLELYDPSRHGQWQIRKGDDGRLEVACIDGTRQDLRSDVAFAVEPEPSENHVIAADTAGTAGQFIPEAHLRDYVAQNLERVERGLELYVDEIGDTPGIEYATPLGRIDILAVDAQGRFIVFEFKVSRGCDAVCGQLLRYMSWVKTHLAKGADVRGYIIANKITERLRYAAAMVPAISLMEYELGFKLKAVDVTQIGPSGNAGNSAAQEKEDAGRTDLV